MEGFLNENINRYKRTLSLIDGLETLASGFTFIGCVLRHASYDMW